MLEYKVNLGIGAQYVLLILRHYNLNFSRPNGAHMSQ